MEKQYQAESTLELAKARLALAKLDARAKTKGPKHKNDASLQTALDMILDYVKVVPEEQKKLDDVIADTIKSLDGHKPQGKIQILLDSFEYQKEMVKTMTFRAANLVDQRIKHLSKIKSKIEIDEELNKCRYGIKDDSGNVIEKGIFYWIRNYAWIVDPRTDTPIYAMPFVIDDYPYEIDCVEFIESLIFRQRRSGVIEKSRDMGITWIVLTIFLYHWLFDDAFQALIGSYNADKVDKIGLPSTMFGKLRLVMKLMPSWMLPKAWTGEIPFMRMVNPDNGNVIEGDTANENFGRSGRYTVIFFDEYASFELAELADTSSSESSKTKLYVSTPKGKLNDFAEKALRGVIPVRSYKWTMHPFKNDMRWYLAKSLEMTKEQIAQELDIDYTASQPGKVYPTYDELRVVITEDEFLEVFPQCLNPVTGHIKPIPRSTLAMAQDVGNTDGHDNISLWLMTAPDGSPKGLSGSIFVYREHIADHSDSINALARKIKSLEYMNNESIQMTDRRISHEADDEVKVYQDHGLEFTKWSTDLNAGISRVRDYIEVNQYHLPHPFRKPMRGIDGELIPIMGRPKLYLIVENGQGELQYNFGLDRYIVTPPVNSFGLKRLREEFPMYHYPKSETGKAVKRQKPEKKFDDAMDCLRCLAATYFPSVTPESQAEILEKNLPMMLREEVIKKQDISEWGRSLVARLEYLREHKELQAKLLKQPLDYRDALYLKAERQI